MPKIKAEKPNLFKVSEHTWFYYERSGLLVVHEACNLAGNRIQTDQFILPWRLVNDAIKQHATKATKPRKRKSRKAA